MWQKFLKMHTHTHTHLYACVCVCVMTLKYLVDTLQLSATAQIVQVFFMMQQVLHTRMQIHLAKKVVNCIS